MKAKQLETIQRHHARFLKHGAEPKPEEDDCAIRLAIVAGKPVRLRSPSEILRAARKKIACNHYSSDKFAFAEVFVSPPSDKLKLWQAKEASRRERVAKYRAIADEAIRKAELDDDIPAEEVSKTIFEAARKYRLYDMV